MRSGDVTDNMVCVGMSNGVIGLFKLPVEMAEAESEEFDRGLFELLQEVTTWGTIRRTKQAEEVDGELAVEANLTLAMVTGK